MLSLVNRSRPSLARLQKTYRVEMNGRTLLLSLGLACLTGLVLFYMGLVAGKGSRTADPVPLVRSPVSESAAPGTSEAGLAFDQALLQEEQMVEDLWDREAVASQQTEALMAQANRELTVEEVPEPSVASMPSATLAQGGSPAAAPAPRRPKAPQARVAANPAPAAVPSPVAPPPTVGGRYTVQVASSQNRASASELLVRLKELGFDAYLNQFQDSTRNVWYRVRVGRTSQSDAQRLKQSLERRASIPAAQIIQL